MKHEPACPKSNFPDLPCHCGLIHVTMELRKEGSKGPYRGSLPEPPKLPTPAEFDSILQQFIDLAEIHAPTDAEREAVRQQYRLCYSSNGRRRDLLSAVLLVGTLPEEIRERIEIELGMKL